MSLSRHAAFTNVKDKERTSSSFECQKRLADLELFKNQDWLI